MIVSSRFVVIKQPSASIFGYLVFLVGTFIDKRARLLPSLVFLRLSRSDEIFVQFVKQRIPGARI